VKTKQLLLTVLYLLLCLATGLAQQEPPQDNPFQQMRSPLGQQGSKASLKAQFRSAWDGLGAT